MTAPALVLFDLDDTLCDYGGARLGRLRGAFGNAFAETGLTGIDLDAVVAESIAIHPHGSDHFPALLARHGVSDPEIQLRARRWYHQNRFLGLKLFPDAIEVLIAVRSILGIRSIGLITNGPQDIQQDKIELLGLRSHIDFAVISGEFGAEKPDQAIFHEALRLGQSDPADAVYVGDSPEFDIEGARASGIPSIWVNRTNQPWPIGTPRPVAITRLSALPPVLTGQRSVR